MRRLALSGAGGRRFQLETSAGPLEADTVVVATGAFHVPRIPAAAAGFAPRITQVHSHHYRNPGQLPPGGVLIVGLGPDRRAACRGAARGRPAGRPGDRQVRACAAPVPRSRRLLVDPPARRAGRSARRRRSRPSASCRTRAAKFACNPHLSGHGGGHDTNLRQMALDGIRLAGRFAGARWDGGTVRAGPGGEPAVRRRILRSAVPADHRQVRRASRRSRYEPTTATGRSTTRPS